MPAAATFSKKNAMKKSTKNHLWFLVILVVFVALCVLLGGCGQTGRTQSLTNNFRDCTITIGPAAGETAAEGDITVNPVPVGAFNNVAHMWTDTSGVEEGTGRNSTPIDLQAEVPINKNEISGDSALASKAASLLPDGASSAAADCPDGACTD